MKIKHCKLNKFAFRKFIAFKELLTKCKNTQKCTLTTSIFNKSCKRNVTIRANRDFVNFNVKRHTKAPEELF